MRLKKCIATLSVGSMVVLITVCRSHRILGGNVSHRTGIASRNVQEGGFDREKCLKDVVGMLNTGVLAPNDTCFWRDHNGTPMSNPEEPMLTLDGCNRLCGGSSFQLYKDRGPRLNTWLIPVMLLLSNVEVSPLDKRRYLMLVHLVGDATDSLWSLLTKMEAWSRCHNLARRINPNDRRLARNLGTVLGAIEEIVGTRVNPLAVYAAIAAKFAVLNTQKVSGEFFARSNLELDLLVARTAQELSDSRTDERLRTLLATALYFYQVLSAFVTIIGGGNTSPPGGRIGTAMFLTWIVPSILLSNAMGTFTSTRTCFTILERFFQDATGEADLWSQLQLICPALREHASVEYPSESELKKCASVENPVHSGDSINRELKGRGTIEDFYDSLSFSGGIYTYRPRKRLTFGTGSNERHPLTLLLLAMSPIIVASVFGCVIIWHTPPLSFNCRDALLVGLTGLQFLSTTLTWIIARIPFPSATAAGRWHATIIKDLFVAIPTVTLIFLSSCGFFNSCYCWSGIWSLGINAHVQLNVIPLLTYNLKTIYPILVSVCLALQIAVFAAMMWSGWSGWTLMRWSETNKMSEWIESRRNHSTRRMVTATPDCV